MIKTIDFKKDLIEVKNKIQKIPSMSKYKKYGKYSTDSICRRFSSWNIALQEVFGEIIREKPPLLPIKKCIQCGKETKNPKFCSRSCAVKTNNSLFPKRPKRKCLRCQKNTQSKTHYCSKCLRLNKIEEYGEKTINDFISTYARHKYQKIRNHAHRVAKHYNLIKKCPYCKDTNHLDLCHIKSIGDFDKNTKLSIVNHIDNLIFLCKNHHWDLDHGFLIIKK